MPRTSKMRISKASLLYWSDKDGTGLMKEGCCGFRRVRECSNCGEIFIEMDLEVEDGRFLCQACRTGHAKNNV